MMEVTMKRIGLSTLLVLALAAVVPAVVQAQDECKVSGPDGTISGPVRRTEFTPGLSIITFSCGNPQANFRVVSEGVTRDKNEAGQAETHTTWQFVYQYETPPNTSSPSKVKEHWTFSLNRIDNGGSPDPEKTFKGIDKVKDTYAKESPQYQVVSDTRGTLGGVSWLVTRTLILVWPVHQDGFLPPDPNTHIVYPRLTVPMYLTVRQVIDTRHNLLYALTSFTFGSDAVDWMDSLQVAP
jgi:hypothetical protein